MFEDFLDICEANLGVTDINMVILDFVSEMSNEICGEIAPQIPPVPEAPALQTTGRRTGGRVSLGE